MRFKIIGLLSVLMVSFGLQASFLSRKVTIKNEAPYTVNLIFSGTETTIQNGDRSEKRVTESLQLEPNKQKELGLSYHSQSLKEPKKELSREFTGLSANKVLKSGEMGTAMVTTLDLSEAEEGQTVKISDKHGLIEAELV